MLEYQSQSSSLTLREGHAEYLSAFSDYLSRRTLSPEAEEFFRCHDIVHIAFGCDLSLQHEMVVKISSFFGTSGGSRVMHGYRLPESKEIYGTIRATEVVTTAVQSLVVVPRVLWRCSRMHKRWPWGDFDEYLDQPLGHIRNEFGIRVAI